MSISGSAVSGIVLVDLQPRDIEAKPDKVIFEKIKSNNENFKSIADVMMYEKATGCSFVFSSAEDLKTLYTAEKFWEKIKDEKDTNLGEHSIFNWANGNKQYCNGKVVTIFRKNKNELRANAPNGGW